MPELPPVQAGSKVVAERTLDDTNGTRWIEHREEGDAVKATLLAKDHPVFRR
jgi:hypothetical protein